MELNQYVKFFEVLNAIGSDNTNMHPKKEKSIKHNSRIVLIVFVCLFAVFLSACNDSTNSSTGDSTSNLIELTPENIERYLDLEVSSKPADTHYDMWLKGEYFDTVMFRVDAHSASPFLKFRDCKIIVKVNGYFDGTYATVNLPVTISLGGTGSYWTEKKLKKSVYFSYAGMENYDAIHQGTYEVVSVTGSVEEID